MSGVIGAVGTDGLKNAPVYQGAPALLEEGAVKNIDFKSNGMRAFNISCLVIFFISIFFAFPFFGFL